MTSPPFPVSVHGGHSGQFCNHAADTLEAIVQAYIAHGYPWVGITEHMPPVSDDYLYPEEIAAGLDAAIMHAGRIVGPGEEQPLEAQLLVSPLDFSVEERLLRAGYLGLGLDYL